ncbi:PLC-like phosphodiesterase [Gymnopus androsaceus JB14]|uniref:Phosphoinositide phospholipase C n=1 Tax=Gymnopus androsaceus JB14 TaxID=1447944 RepID=A0A6A4HQ76_9AGAR|nr:PLC-like phosphodiesterase [Gymnopus androsaceus JB14]
MSTANENSDNLTSVPPDSQEWRQFVKVSEWKIKQALFRIDADEGQILYESNKIKKIKIIPIECIKELRFQSDSSYYRTLFKLSPDTQSRWITIIYIVEGAYKIMHIIAPSSDVFQQWKESLNKLYAVRQGLMAGAYDGIIRDTVWEKQYWKSADCDGDEKLKFDDVQGLCRRLSLHFSEQELRKLFKAADVDGDGYLDFAGYQKFVKLLKRRPEVENLYQKVSDNEKMDFVAFKKFMQGSQESKLDDNSLRAVFTKYAGMEQFNDTGSPAQSMQTEAHPLEPTTMNLEAFSAFLRSSDNAALPDQNKPVYHDMTRPISEYFISSSHNTYLIGNQLVGVSTIEGYIRALLHSCRTVMDVYDGPEEPMVYHGNTLTSKVSVREICHAIAKYAFRASPYPVILTLEMHCGVQQQNLLVDIMKNAFGDALISAPVEGRKKITSLPSPEDLRGKILVKLEDTGLQPKKPAKSATADDSSSSSAASSASHSGLMGEIKDIKAKLARKVYSKTKSNHKQMSFSLASLLVYTVGVKCRGISPTEHYEPEHVFSISENSANKYMKSSMTDLVKHTQSHIIRVYPKGARVDSSNYEPHLYWAAGGQVVALNWQTFDLGYMINYAMFQRNGRSGYVLKPLALRPGNESLLQKPTKHYLDLTIISAQQLPRLKDKSGKEIQSILSLHIPLWSHSPFVANEAENAEGATYSPATNVSNSQPTTARTVMFSTGSVKNNGFNPVWQEELCIPFDCVGGMIDIIFVKFAIKQEKKKLKDEVDEEPIAVYCCSLGALEHGFRYLPLHDSQMSTYMFSTLFVEVKVRDI